jgi:hypothetical protein
VERIARLIGFAIELHFPGVRCVCAGEDFHECAFAGSVLADEGVDFAGEDFEVDATESDGGAEGFADAPHEEAWDGGGHDHAGC